MNDQDSSRIDKGQGKPVRTPRPKPTQKEDVIMKKYLVYPNSYEGEPSPPSVKVSAEGVGVTEDGHLLFTKGKVFIEGFGSSMWKRFVEVDNDESVEAEEVVDETIVEEAIVEPVVEEPVVDTPAVEEDFIEEVIEIEVVEDTTEEE